MLCQLLNQKNTKDRKAFRYFRVFRRQIEIPCI